MGDMPMDMSAPETPQDYSAIYGMAPNVAASITTFSEVDKGKNFENDALGILNVIHNRANQPQRFGNSVHEVVMSPKQFSGVGTPEWDKAFYKKFTKEEEKLFKRILQLSHGVWTGKLSDNTGGADHYYNPKLASPQWADVYEKTYSSGSHDYHSERQQKVSPKTKKTFSEAFADARKAGRADFWWRSKKYSTELAE